MATPTLSLLYQPFNAIIDSLVLDASVKEEHMLEVDITDHAVEQGSAISDHARKKPDTFTIEGYVSNTPLNHLQTSRATTFEGVNYTTSAAQNSVRGMPGNAESAYVTLQGLVGKLVTVITALRTYTNVTLESLKVPRDAQTGDGLKFEAKFKEIRIVTNTVTVVATKKPGAKKPQKLGSQTTTSNANQNPANAPIYIQNKKAELEKLLGNKSG